MAEKTVKEYQAIAEEARRDVVRAKLRETIRDMRAGKQQISENSLYGDNEIGILHNMLKDAGLKKGEDYIDEVGYEGTELYIRIEDKILHFDDVMPYTEIENVNKLLNEIEDIEISTSNPDELLKLRPIELEKLGIVIEPLEKTETTAVTEQEIKWFRDIESMNRDYKKYGLSLDDILTDAESDLYVLKDSEIYPNWNGIYCKLFGKDGLKYSELVDDLPKGMDVEDIQIPKCRIPKGMKDIFEVDSQGNPTGRFNWNYVASLIEMTSQENDSEHQITDFLPSHIGLVMENIDDPSELFEILSTGGKGTKTGVDINCPDSIRDNPSRMLKLFEYIRDEGEEDYISNFWELASDRLQGNIQFIEDLAELLGEDDFEFVEEFTGMSKEELLERARAKELSPLAQKEEELSSLEAEAKTISEAEALIDQQKEGQDIGEE